MLCTFRRALSAVLPLVLFVHSQASGQEPSLEVFYTKLEPKEEFKYKWKDKEVTANAGVLRWEVPETEFGTNGFDRNFTGYCSEVLVPIAEASEDEVLSQKNFSALDAAELAALYRLMVRLQLATPERRTRRKKRGCGG